MNTWRNFSPLSPLAGRYTYLLAALFLFFSLMPGAVVQSQSPLTADSHQPTAATSAVGESSLAKKAPHFPFTVTDAQQISTPNWNLPSRPALPKQQQSPKTATSMPTGLSCTGMGLQYGACQTMGFSDFLDISSTGTSISLGDDGEVLVPIGFFFDYYGTDYSTLYINANGFVSFESFPTPGSYTPLQMGDASLEKNMIAGWWHDLHPGLGGTIHYQTFGGSEPDSFMVIQYTDIQHLGGGNPVTFQIKLYKTTNHIQITYLNAPSDGGSHSVGYNHYDAFFGAKGMSSFWSTDSLDVAATPSIMLYDTNIASGCFAYLISTGTPYGSSGVYHTTAVKDALAAAAASDTIRLAGDCISYDFNGIQQSSKSITYVGGYSTSNWNTHNPSAYPTIWTGAGYSRLYEISGGYVWLAHINFNRGSAGNTFSFYGGAIQARGTALANISGSKIGWSSAAAGGAVRVGSDAYFRMHSVNGINRIHDNSASSYGAGIYSTGAQIEAVGPFTNIIEDNQSGWGAGLYLEPGSSLGSEADDHLFIRNNTATNGGGGIYNQGGTITLNAAVNKLRIEGNSASYGAGIYSDNGTVDLTNMQLWSNNSSGVGGGIETANGSPLTLDGADIDGNTATSSGGGIYHSGSGAINIQASAINNNSSGSNGAGIYNIGSGTPSIGATTISGNNATGGGGGIYHSTATSLGINNVTISNNSAGQHGGGIYNGALATISNDYSVISNNTATQLGGGAYNLGSILFYEAELNGNTADTGGGVWNNNSLIFNLSSAVGNSTTGGTGGAGFYNETGGSALIQTAYFATNNSGGGGGALRNNGSMTIRNSSIINNVAAFGAGIDSRGISTYIENSTVSGNTVGGGIMGGGVGTVYLNNVTVANSSGGGVGIGAGSTLVLNNSLIADSSGGADCIPLGGVINDQGFNLIEDGSCITEPTSISGDPQLLPLANNGGGSNPAGVNPTHASTYPSSPAMNSGDCRNGSEDYSQNGVTRPWKFPAYCDIGAYEHPKDGTSYLDLGHNFRTMELTNWDLVTNVLSRTVNTLPDIQQNFLTYDSGRLFYRYCVDHNQLQANLAAPIDAVNLCPAWDGANPPGLASPNDINIKLRQSYFDFAEMAYQQEAMPIPYQTAISGTIYALREQSYISMLYGNEFAADGIRYQIYYTGTGTTILNNEIIELQRAHQQFHLVTTNFGLSAPRELPDGPVWSYFKELDLELFAIASTRQAETAVEIANRQWLLGQEPAAVTFLQAEYERQQQNANLLQLWASTFPSPTQVIQNNYGPEIAFGMEELSNLLSEIQSNNDPLGYRDIYVPRISYPEMRDLTIGLPSKPFETAAAAELLARNAQLSHEQDATAMNNALTDVRNEYAAQLLDLCGIDLGAGGNWTDPCNGGAMAKSGADLLAAGGTIDLALQHISNAAQRIRIEQELSEDTIMVTLGTAEAISLDQLQIGKLNATQTVNTQFETDTHSTREKVTTEVKTSVKVEGKVSSNPLNNEASVTTSVETSLALTSEEEWEQTSGNTKETISNPNLEQIAQYESFQILREAEGNAAIVNAESAAEVRRLLLDQTDAMIELTIVQAEYTAVLAEHNLIVAQYQALIANNEAALLDATEYYEKPAYRLLQDQTSLLYHNRFDLLINYAFLTAKSLEYELLDPALIQYNNLYTARSTDEVKTFLDNLEAIYLTIGYTPADIIENHEVSVVKDVLGLTPAHSASLLPFTVDPLAVGWPAIPECQVAVINNSVDLNKCLFQEFLATRVMTDTGSNNVVLINFATTLEKIYSGDTWNARITKETVIGECTAIPCPGVVVNILTDQPFIGAQPKGRLTYRGMGTYLANNGADVVQYQPGPPRLVGYDIPLGFPTAGSTAQALTFHVNGDNNGSTGNGMYLLGAVNNGWVFRLDKNAATNADLVAQLANVTDIVIQVQTVAHSIQGSPLEQKHLELLEAYESGRQPSAKALAEYQTLLDKPYQPAPLSSEDQKWIDGFVASMQPTAATYIEPQVAHGLYEGLLMSTGFAEFGVFISATQQLGSQAISGTLCITCSAMLNTAVPLTGWFTETGTTTDLFTLSSAPFVEVVNGQSMTKTVSLTGVVVNVGNTISGTYREDTTDSFGNTLTLYGDLFTARPKRYPGAVTSTLAISLTGLDVDLAWSFDDANCNYQLYRSATPYFARYPRQLVDGTLINFMTNSSTDIGGSGNPALNRYYRVRSLSCDTNVDYLQPSASYFEDSNEVGVFSFTIVPGS